MTTSLSKAIPRLNRRAVFLPPVFVFPFTAPFFHAERDRGELDSRHPLVGVHHGSRVGLVRLNLHPGLHRAERHAPGLTQQLHCPEHARYPGRRED